MSDHDKDDLAGVEALPVYDRVTSKFMWLKKSGLHNFYDIDFS